MPKKLLKGFSIVEIMVVVVIVALIITMGLPSYLRARSDARKKSCIANLWQINEAVKQWVLDVGASEGASLTEYEDEIYTYLRSGKPSCPSGGTYTLGTVGTEPQVTCSKEADLGHKLE
jgi:prepilin-type N-terminal cleavage/methylation domain-containing protein